MRQVYFVHYSTGIGAKTCLVGKIRVDGAPIGDRNRLVVRPSLALNVQVDRSGYILVNPFRGSHPGDGAGIDEAECNRPGKRGNEHNCTNEY